MHCFYDIDRKLDHLSPRIVAIFCYEFNAELILDETLVCDVKFY